MQRKLNCWEFKNCGCEPGGANTRTFGICPAALAEHADCIHGGVNAGRICWAVAGTCCNGSTMGHFRIKVGSCLACDFYALVEREEGRQFVSVDRILAQLGRAS